MSFRYAFALVLATVGTFALAQEPPATPTPPAPPAATQEPAKDPELDKFEKAVKDLTRYEGVFTLYKRGAEVLLELPEERIGQEFILQATMHSGIDPFILQTGTPLTDDLYRWERKEDIVALVRPNRRFRWSETNPYAPASELAFAEGIVDSFKIEAKHPERKTLLLNVTDIFHGNLIDLQSMVNAGAGGNYQLDRDLTGIDQVKSFAENTVVRMGFHYKGAAGGGMNLLALILGGGGGNNLEDSRSVPFKVTYNLWYRKPSAYVPRLADPRVGYFTQDFFNVDRMTQAERTDRLIIRWNLVKKDPSAEVSEPVKPIVWTLDPSIPEKYRDAVKRGILMWNPAFESAGFRNAMVVQDPPTDPDYDHADGRYNVVRWVMSENAGYAIALFRSDPITGEILNAAVNVDANYAESTENEYEILVRGVNPSAQVAELARQTLVRTPHDHDPLEPTAEEQLWDDEHAHESRIAAWLNQHGWRTLGCRNQEGKADQARLGLLMMRAQGLSVSKKEYTDQLVAELIAHEVGHCLGLRHNFVGSTLHTTEELNDDQLLSATGLTSSVMEYNPVNIQAVLKGGGVFFNPVVGPYDHFAIRYGYTPSDATTPNAERGLLRGIARESGEPGHLYLTDEDADGINPLAVRWDYGSDTLAYLSREMTAFGKLRKYAATGMARRGDSYHRRNAVILSSTLRVFSRGRAAARFIGGIEYRRQFKGDVGEKPTLAPVDPSVQREALRLILENCFTLDAVDVPPSVLIRMNQDPNGVGASWNAPLRDILANQQIALLSTLMSAGTTDRIVENEFKQQKRADRYTIAEHYGALTYALFGHKPETNVSPVRRDVQRFMVDGLIVQASVPAGGLSEDTRVAARRTLEAVRQLCDETLAVGVADASTRMHVEDLRDRITRYQQRIVVGS